MGTVDFRNLWYTYSHHCWCPLQGQDKDGGNLSSPTHWEDHLCKHMHAGKPTVKQQLDYLLNSLTFFYIKYVESFGQFLGKRFYKFWTYQGIHYIYSVRTKTKSSKILPERHQVIHLLPHFNIKMAILCLEIKI